MPWSRALLITVPMAVLAAVLNAGPIPVLILSAIALIPLAALIGEATEELAARTGPVVGGLLNATMGNAAELIIALAGIRAGLLDLVKASITGCIIGNLLLVMGLSLLVGGWRHGVQRFSRERAGVLATMTVISFIALGIPTLFSRTIAAHHPEAVGTMSLEVAGLMLALYGLSVVYTLRARQPLSAHVTHPARWSPSQALGILAAATAGVVAMSELLVHAVEPSLKALGLTEFFVGIILIPLVGNVAEHFVAVQVAAEDRIDLSLEIAVGSSLQIALLVAPVLVFASLAMGQPMDLVFHPLELVAVVMAGIIAAFIALDGETNWLEGAQLLAVYGMLGIAFFFV
ncbi:calcium/proton exchanger [Thermoflexus sp.]|uniref:calcium/proton exchanger n=1 Tax=Thermoflexus sp. TaxID=1969742 RepID=UPI0025F37217|nr:calcium/proton exchanger [Thermoflexus sp.]MDW8179839.1 calcium/proton exchanger [Anaerolineae bacterium]MCS6963446.1 calcium/proton exchanger [Thermoflexus sp.]MCS7350388.1 calcium/proton exchanger [Thermoflexus sp.]MCX7689934.1 calcium/proton exchanger [Thermoflexus sp.]MDW8184179.1 calcium/proton exchanger [Anaerolineae bacterium]